MATYVKEQTLYRISSKMSFRILPTFKELFYTNYSHASSPSPAKKKKKKEENTSHHILWGQYYTDIKTRQNITEMQATDNIPYE